jgi:hypothetical protein
MGQIGTDWFLKRMAVMKGSLVLYLVLLGCAACSPYAGLRKKTFSYNTSLPQTLHTLVPKRYAKQEALVDSAGNPHQVYRYSNGAFLYFIQTTDTFTLFQPIDTAANIALPHPFGGQMYKGLDSSGRYWREIRTDSFRFGYRFVPESAEHLFDSAVNYASMRRFLE